tara:strand:+ start:302 stop:541 length:240 start_codon:yes stop_codon:yes gene_type:complete
MEQKAISERAVGNPPKTSGVQKWNFLGKISEEMFKVSGHCKELYRYLVMLRGEMSTLFALMKVHKTKTLIGFVYRFDFC